MSDTPRTDALADKMPTRTMDEGILLDHSRQLERENAALLAANKDCLAHFDSLKADYDALRADAERYRWLREKKASNNTHCWHFQGGPIIPALLTLDSAIDAAREGK